MTPDRFKQLAAAQLAQGARPADLKSATEHYLGEAEALLFLAGGWQEYTTKKLIPRTVDTRHVQLPKPSKRSTTPPKPKCLYEGDIVERCSCPNISLELAVLRHVYECTHPKQDGALCTRGPNNGKVIYCADCNLHLERA